MAVHRPTGIGAGLLAVVAAVGLTALALTGGAATAQVDDAAGADRGIEVVGVGTASGTPDVLRFTVGVEVTAASVDAALSEANEAAARLLDVLQERGVAEEHLQTAAVQVHPRHDERGQQIVGYVVRQDVAVTVTDLDAAGGLMTAAVQAGGDAARLSGVSFALEDDEALLAQARERAYEQARAKAEQYADLVGTELGDVVSVREDVQSAPGPFGRARADSATASDVPIAPGSTEVSVRADVRWAMR